MKITTTKKVTKLIVAKTTVIEGHPNIKTVYKAGRVLEVKKHKKFHYYPWKYVITLGHGMHEVIPVENLKVKWFIETKTVTIKNKELKVK
jgi:hypothetical protein